MALEQRSAQPGQPRDQPERRQRRNRPVRPVAGHDSRTSSRASGCRDAFHLRVILRRGAERACAAPNH